MGVVFGRNWIILVMDIYKKVKMGFMNNESCESFDMPILMEVNIMQDKKPRLKTFPQNLTNK